MGTHIDGVLAHYGLSADFSNEAPRYIYFFDTPDLDLFKAGVIARAQRIPGRDHDSTLKVHPVVPAAVPDKWRQRDYYALEADTSEVRVTKTASLTAPVSKGLIKKVVSGEKGIAKLFTKEQEAFLTDLGVKPINYASLCVLGPVEGHHLTFDDPACPWDLNAEVWQREDGARLAEIAIKVPLAQAEVATAGFKVFIDAVGPQRNMKQQSKTRWVLEHYLKAGLRDLFI